jgi:hypothetical protein
MVLGWLARLFFKVESLQKSSKFELIANHHSGLEWGAWLASIHSSSL